MKKVLVLFHFSSNFVYSSVIGNVKATPGYEK